MSRKLDAAIAEALEKNIRWEKTESGIGHDIFVDAMPDDRGAKPYIISQHDDCRVGEVPHYSTDGNAMLELDGEMQRRGWYLTNLVYYSIDKNWEAKYQKFYKVGKARIIWHSEKAAAWANIEPLARAKTAYRALTGKEWGG